MTQKRLEWKERFDKHLDPNTFDPAAFDRDVVEYQKFLSRLIHILPGPQHPAAKFYRRREKKREAKGRKEGMAHSSNPQRARESRKEDAAAEYAKQKHRFDYYNCRKRAVRDATQPNSVQDKCEIDIGTLHAHFQERFGSPNDAVRPDSDYCTVSPEEQKAIDDAFDSRISEEEAKDAMDKTRADTSPGGDSIYARAIKSFEPNGAIIASIATAAIIHNHYPTSLKEIVTVLLPKKDADLHEPGSWRPIGITSIMRRVLNRILDVRYRRYVSFNENQRGFVKSPGCHISIRIIDGCLRQAAEEKRECYVTQFDVTKAFDHVGHRHLERTLSGVKMPTALRRIIISSITGNFTRLRVGSVTSKPIIIQRGVVQGDPLSATNFNVSIDFALDEISDVDVAQAHGFCVSNGSANNASTAPGTVTADEQAPLYTSTAALADDTSTIARNRFGAARLGSIFTRSLALINLRVNAKKSRFIGVTF